MKNKIYNSQIVLTALLILFSVTACNNWLDVKPKTEEEAEELFSNMDNLINSVKDYK